jgi:hypothetical protein
MPPPSVERERPNLIAADATFTKCAAHRTLQSIHLRAMTLGGEVGILCRAMQRVLRDTCAQPPFTLAEERDTHTQCPEIDARHDAQQLCSPR